MYLKRKTKITASGPITLWQIQREKSGNSDRFYFGGSKIPVYRDCSLEIKRCLLLGRKAMTNLESLLRSRDITLLTKVYIVKVTVLPVVMYRWHEELYLKEGWALKNCYFWIVVLKKTLGSPLDCKEIKSVNPKRNQP